MTQGDMNYCVVAEYKKVDNKSNIPRNIKTIFQTNENKLIYLKNPQINGLSTEMLIVKFEVLGFIAVPYTQ
ncbi:hypothetical protein RPO_00430 [Rickettsia rickettsii str. Arizona]|uniref:Uncharacterized protein n=2 Tax=Rickettsia rickettsii TaxID=783 RepID=A0A0H3AVP3_RICRS|nr:hypothetical protein A1G_00445 [Rickettsia rickettsii str. 'Sheila Smith']AFB22760.1 hypothetical protein RPN_06465 [Rickettsia rickettsii str. Brazil]AFB23005.1 hypothetical protein RPL_00430 [Rickettsia rickettsii str. Colombia]AFB24355.1 hypothetical protein RPO_00430 [Rickettsia rickettsii str. Arizona]AFB27042.1 hypothetical protein RPJ_00430 [Rickettsia rickettsii str. Hino]AFB28387.1 hypothetical protein RPK_00405 [Rickettsia rickettsii str. Hlp\